MRHSGFPFPRFSAMALAGLLAGAGYAAQAADASGAFSLIGAGSVSCETYTTATAEQRLHAETWWAGYMTAMNRTTPDTYDLLGDFSVDDANAWLFRYCTQNPQTPYAIAVHDMLEAFYPMRQRSGD